MDYQTFRSAATSRRTNKQKIPNRNNLSDHNYKFFAKKKMAKLPYMISQNQPQAQNCNQQVPQQASYSVFFNDQQRSTVDCSENFPFFQQKEL